MPTEVLDLIFGFLSCQDRLRMRQTCHTLNTLITSLPIPTIDVDTVNESSLMAFLRHYQPTVHSVNIESGSLEVVKTFVDFCQPKVVCLWLDDRFQECLEYVLEKGDHVSEGVGIDLRSF